MMTVSNLNNCEEEKRVILRKKMADWSLSGLY